MLVSTFEFVSRGCAVVLMAFAAAGGAFSQEAGRPRVVILGFDGVEPTLVDRMLGRGELPNLAKLKDSGTYAPLGTTTPPQSPSAWSTFATSTDPVEHGVFDFLGRDPETYYLIPGFFELSLPKYAADGALLQPMTYTTARKGDSFWLHADRNGKRCKVLNVPVAYPADPLEHGLMLCGLGVPDVRGTQSFSYWMANNFSDADLAEDVSGGLRVPLRFKDDVAVTRISTVQKPRVQGQPAQYVTIPMAIRVDRAAKSVTIQLALNQVVVKQGEWSEWVEWTIPVTPRARVRALSQFYLLEAGDAVRLYMSCLQFHPNDPVIPISAPNEYATQLRERYGPYKTIGWEFDTHALKQDGLDEDGFLDDCAKTAEWRARMTYDELDRGDFDMLISVWTDTDRISHMFWRYRDPKHPLYTEDGAKKYGDAVEISYRRMDEIIGEVMKRLGPDDLLMIMSDHGFHSFRVGFNVNTWLVRNGYLALRGQTDPATAYSDRKMLSAIDWNNTRAYGVALGGIFLNLQGREAAGNVPQADASQLMAEIKQKLSEITYTPTGEKVFNKIVTRDELGSPDSPRMPDIQLGYADGFQTAKPSTSGASPKEIFELNQDKWSGEHAAAVAEETPGILFSNRKIELSGAGASIHDLGPTALDWIGCPPFEQAKGKSLNPAK